MKLQGIIFSVCFFAIQIVTAKEIVISKGEIYKYNDLFKHMSPCEYSLRYDTDDKTLGIYFPNNVIQSAFFFNDEQRLKLIGYIDKYKEWNKQAKVDKVKLEKEIGKFRGRGFWNYGGDWESTGLERDITVLFFSQTTKTHQMVLQFEKWVSNRNEYITLNPD